MIMLHAFGPRLGLPDSSPFVMKTDVQLKMSGLPIGWTRPGSRRRPRESFPIWARYYPEMGEVAGCKAAAWDAITEGAPDLDASTCGADTQRSRPA